MAVEPLLSNNRHTCEHCVFRQLFARSGLTREQIAALGNANIRCRGPYERGERICRVGDRANSLFVITSGAVKTEIATPNGLQVTGFFLTGESFGAEAIGRDTLPFDAIALQKTAVCELSCSRLENLCVENQRLQHEVLLFLAERIRTHGYQWMLRRNLTAEHRIMCFLRDLRRRLAIRQGSEPHEMRLPMTKEDIACFLTLTPATLSRVLGRLEGAGVLRNRHKTIELLDREAVDAHYALCD